jgi:hypothetical protein
MAMKLLSLILIFGVHLQASADAARCASYTHLINHFQAKFLGLPASNEEEIEAGMKEVEKAQDTITIFDKLSAKDPCQLVVWKDYVNLAQAQSPFDGESGAADIINTRLVKNPSLRAAYDEAVSSYGDSCRSQLLTSAVTVNQCVSAHGGKSALNKTVEECAKQNTFDFEKCQADKAKK